MASLKLTDADKVEYDEPAPAAGGAQVIGPQDKVEYDDAPPVEQPGRLEALARGAKQGLTFGFGDELAGALDYVLSGGQEGSYTKGRDEARAKDAAAKQAHGGYFTAGEVGGGVASSFIPGVGELGGLVKGTGFAANAVRGAGAGILSGIGNSEGKSVQDIAKDAALSGLAGGAVGGVAGVIGNKLVGGAAQRVENADLAGLKEGVQYSTKLKTFGKATPEAPEGQFTGSIKAALKAEPEIKSAVNKDAHRALSMVEQKVDGLTETLDHIYSKADLGGPVPVKRAADGLEEAAKRFTTTADEGIADTIRGVGQRLAEKYPEGIPVPALRAEYRGWQDLANKSMKLFGSKSPREEAAEATANALRETLQSHIATVAEEMPHLGISRKALEATNKDVSTWIKVQTALTEKATRQNIQAAPFGDTVNAVGSFIKAPIRTTLGAVGKLGRPADVAVAKMIVAAQKGDKMAQMALRALQTGAPRGLAANAEDLPGAALDVAAAPFLPNDQPY